MPEGPEVWILSLALQKLGFSCVAYGKHLYFPETKEDWSFGLSGTIHVVSDSHHVEHKYNGYIPGKVQMNIETFDQLKQKNKLGINWLTCAEKELRNMVNNWVNKKAKLGSLLLQQAYFCGIGIAYGSEILHHAHLSPDIPANQQNLNSLAASMLFIRESIINQYLEFLKQQTNSNLLEIFCNKWFRNLYQIRTMSAYQKEGTQKIKIGNRTWYL